MSVKFGQFVYLGQDLELARKILKERNNAYDSREYQAQRKARHTPSGKVQPVAGSNETFNLYGVDRQAGVLFPNPMPVDYFMGTQDDKDNYDAIAQVKRGIEYFNSKPMLGMNEPHKPEHDQIDALSDLAKKLVYGALESIAPAIDIVLQRIPSEKN